MRRTRWDQKPINDNGNPNWRDWHVSAATSQSNSDGRPFPNSPSAPLDYSRENHDRALNFSLNDPKKDKIDPPAREENSHLPHPWAYMGNPQMFPNLNQDSQFIYNSYNGLSHRNYSDNFNQRIFDLKWWAEQKEYMNDYLGDGEEYGKRDRDKNLTHRISPWSFGMKVPKDGDRYSNNRHNRHYGSHFNRSYRDQRPFSQNGNSFSRYKYDRMRENRHRTMSVGHFSRDPSSSWKSYNQEFSAGDRCDDFVPYTWDSNVEENLQNNLKNKRGKSSSSKGKKKKKNANNRSITKKVKKSNSIAETAKKKALAVAADKLKKTFLASKNQTKRKYNSKKSKNLNNGVLIQEDSLDPESGAQDLSLSKYQNNSNLLEYDIDIRFSAQEWESVGRGEGGMRNILEAAPEGRKNQSERHSDSESVQTVEDSDSKESSDSDSDSLSDVEEWHYEQPIDPPLRRRHASETCILSSKNDNTLNTNLIEHKTRRFRSLSTSQVEDSSKVQNETSKNGQSITSNLKSILLKELLGMNKKSLQEFVNDPKSTKARHVMGHLMTLHKAAISQKLNQLRFKSLPSSASTEEEIHFWQSVTPAQLESLPSDVLQQVKDILAFEQSGKGEQEWDQVSLSINDLMGGLKNTENEEENKGNSIEINEDACIEIQQLPLPEILSDPECQIVTPPPKRPATTITIPDSDSELVVDPSLQDGELSNLKNTQSSTLQKIDSPANAKKLETKRVDSLNLSLNELEKLDKGCSESFQSPSILLPPPPTPPNKSLINSVKTKNVSSPDSRFSNSNLLNDTAENSVTVSLDNQTPCELNLPPPSVKVKQERPSPMSECGYCLHAPRSPHTPHCAFPPFGISSSPVPLISGPPRPLGQPHPRPVPHLPSQLNVFKHEKHGVSFVSLDVNRPSSEERPKNPAPPDATNSEPPSPLPILPPPAPLHPTLHQPPQPLIFSPETRFTEPPRPPSPPPPHSPRIKFERQTPQFVCCCMRNECERSSSHQSADFLRGDSRRGTITPQNQLCEAAQRVTPQIYKMEQYLSNPRNRTPHANLVNVFHMQPSPRCIPSNSSSLGMNEGLSHSVNGTIQTDGNSNLDNRKQQHVSKTRSTISQIGRIDKATNTEVILPVLNEINAIENVFQPQNKIIQSNPLQNSFYDKVDAAIKSIREFTWDATKETSTQILHISAYEEELLSFIEELDKRMQKLMCDRASMVEALKTAHSLRSKKLKDLSLQNEKGKCTQASDNNNSTAADKAINTDNEINGTWQKNEENISHCLPENLSIVSSSQEEVVGNELNEAFNDSSNESQTLQGQGCTSTSLIADGNNKTHCNNYNTSIYKDINSISNTESDTDADVHLSKAVFTKKRTVKHFSKKLDTFSRRRRTDSISTSDDETKVKEDINPRDESEDSFDKNFEAKDFMVSSNQEIIKQEGNSFSGLELSMNREDTFSNEEDNFANGTISCRKVSLSLSPLSPKTRNSSGSEHGYSLRSRGPPSESFDSESQLSKELNSSISEAQLESSDEKQCLPLKLQKMDNDLENESFNNAFPQENTSRTSLEYKCSNEEKRTRKRKSKKYKGNRRKRKKDQECLTKDESIVLDIKEDFSEVDKHIFIDPPPHKDAILELKVVGRYILSASSDGTARLYDPSLGLVLATYMDHTDSVTSVQIVNKTFNNGNSSFDVVTGSEDRALRIYNGKTGELLIKKIASEPIRCLEYRWSLLFIGTDGGSGIKWNLKDKRLGERVQFCGKGITCLLAHNEGGRKVLVVCAKTTPIMIRDALSGLFLRTLERTHLTVYSAVFEGNLLYTGGTDRYICIYDFCSGHSKLQLSTNSAVSQVMLHKNYLIVICYDSCIRIFKLPDGQLMHALTLEMSEMFCSSTLYKTKILLGNKQGEVITCDLPDLDSATES